MAPALTLSQAQALAQIMRQGGTVPLQDGLEGCPLRTLYVLLDRGYLERAEDSDVDEVRLTAKAGAAIAELQATAKTIPTGVSDVGQVQKMAELLREVQDAYVAKLDQSRTRNLETIAYVHRVKQEIDRFHRQLLKDYWRLPLEVRPDLYDVIDASVSRARMYQIRDEVLEEDGSPEGKQLIKKS